jgi:Protein of unknown function (DUF2971)
MTKTPKEVFETLYRNRRYEHETKFINFVTPTIYHYTNISSFIEIFRSKRLFASRSEFLNDMTEFRYGQQIAIEQIDALEKISKHTLFAAKMKNAFGTDVMSPFIACFCGDGDLLSQWRGYSHQGQGISVGFRADILKNVMGARINNVIYDREMQVKLVDGFLYALANSYDEVGLEIDFNDLVGYTGALERYCALLKDPGFKEEGEIRLVVPDFNISGDYEVKFRARNDLIVPYIEVDLSKSWDTIFSEIIVGPGPDREIRKRNIEHFLTLLQVAVPVKLSTCQFR